MDGLPVSGRICWCACESRAALSACRDRAVIHHSTDQQAASAESAAVGQRTVHWIVDTVPALHMRITITSSGHGQPHGPPGAEYRVALSAGPLERHQTSRRRHWIQINPLTLDGQTVHPWALSGHSHDWDGATRCSRRPFDKRYSQKAARTLTRNAFCLLIARVNSPMHATERARNALVSNPSLSERNKRKERAHETR